MYIKLIIYIYIYKVNYIYIYKVNYIYIILYTNYYNNIASHKNTDSGEIS